MPSTKPTEGGIHKIKHVVVIMQENRSFDSYFGTYWGADGIPMRDGVPTVCSPDPRSARCIKPFHDSSDLNHGGPHTAWDATADIDAGKMDGFVRQVVGGAKKCAAAYDPSCAGTVDAMGYHDAREIPNYWGYAQNFVLQDHMFESNASWSLPQHLFMLSEWSAKCSRKDDPMSCENALQTPEGLWAYSAKPKFPGGPNYAWTDLTYLLHKQKVSWKYYVDEGSQPDCAEGEMLCPAQMQSAHVPEIWNPLPFFSTVREDGQLGNIQEISHFYEDAQTGRLPAVSWIVPNGDDSEHPPGLVSRGQAYVTRLVDTIMRSSAWDSTAIFISWDDWGGFYDHVKPPQVDENGYGLRVPGLVISPYAKHGFIDHQVLSFDAYTKFIEDDFLRGARIDPATDGRPDTRPTVRERSAELGDLVSDFDFSQSPRSPLILRVGP